MKAVIFPSNSTMLTPAFTPEMVSMAGMGVGPLGDYLNNCVSPPAAPCGGNVTIEDTGANLSGEGSVNVLVNGTPMAGGASGTMGAGMSPTASAVAFTGGARRIAIDWHAVAVAVGAGLVALMLVG